MTSVLPADRRTPQWAPWVVVVSMLAALLGPALLPVAPAASASETVSLSVSESSWVSSRSASQVMSVSSALSVTRQQDRSYLKFTLPAGVTAQDISAARLVLNVSSSTATKPGLVVHAERGPWSSSSLTYENRPAETGERLNEVAPVALKGERLVIELDNLEEAIVDGVVTVRLSYEQAYIQSRYVRTGAGAPTLEIDRRADVATPTPAPATPAPAPTPTPTVTAPAPGHAPTPLTEGAASDKLVFAHYFPPYPISIDNANHASDYYARNYLSPAGENGKHAAYGGLLRDRPRPVEVSTSRTWKLDNARLEVRQAKEAGIDGFTINIMSLSGTNWDQTLRIAEAAAIEGEFVVVPMIDATASVASLSPVQIADRLADLYAFSSAYRLDDEYLLSSFAAERKSVDWWSQVINALARNEGLPITFQAVFLNAGDANMKAFQGIADGYGAWGVRTVHHTSASPDYASKAAAYGKTWMAPVSIQDFRPRSKVYAEAGNTGNLRASWEGAISRDADFVQLVTWNDYSENTQFAPSERNGMAFLELTAYYADWFRTGSAPAIAADQIYLSHRTQFSDAKTKVPHALASPTLGGQRVTPSDNVEVVLHLTAPAKVTVRAGSTSTTFDAPAGESVFTVPLQYGTISASVVRGSSVTAQVTSPFQVVKLPTVQDLRYVGVSSSG